MINNPNNRTQKRAVIYCRVSTKEQVEEGNSLVTQEKICREYALRNGYDIAEIFIEQGESAKTADRTELKRLFTYCANRKNQIAAIISYKIDRISRNTDDYSQIRILLKNYGVEIKSTSENFENTPAGRFMENMIANVAQFDNDVRTERSVGGLKEAMRDGRYVWCAPCGYKNIRISGKATIAPDEMAPLVRKTFQLIASHTFQPEEVRKKMNEEGLRSKTGKIISKSQFYRMLHNETYSGWIIKFGERHKGLFEPLISEEVFSQAQRALRFRGKRNLHYLTENPDFPLRRFVYHVPSGKKLSGSWSQGRRAKYPYYCIRSEHLNFRKDELEKKFNIFFDGYRIDKEHYSKLMQLAKKHLITQTEEAHKKRMQLEYQIKELKEQQKALIQKNYKGVINDEVLKQQLEYIEQDRYSAEDALIKLPNRKRDIQKLLELVKDYLEDPSKYWIKAHFETRLRLQWFNFPKGVIFENGFLRTTEICSIFKAKTDFLDNQSHDVALMHSTPNTHSENTCKNKEIFWELFANDLEDLAGIIEKINSESV
jgi:site-specific DNA recombinase